MLGTACVPHGSPGPPWDTNTPQVHEYLEASLGSQRLRAVQAGMCTPPLETCMRINTMRCSRDDAIAELREMVRDGRVAHVGAFEAHPSLDAVVRFQGSGPHDIDFDAAGALPHSTCMVCVASPSPSMQVAAKLPWRLWWLPSHLCPSKRTGATTGWIGISDVCAWRVALPTNQHALWHGVTPTL